MEWKTMAMFFGAILLSAHVLTVSTAPDSCAKGKPSPGRFK